VNFVRGVIGLTYYWPESSAFHRTLPVVPNLLVILDRTFLFFLVLPRCDGQALPIRKPDVV